MKINIHFFAYLFDLFQQKRIRRRIKEKVAFQRQQNLFNAQAHHKQYYCYFLELDLFCFPCTKLTPLRSTQEVVSFGLFNKITYTFKVCRVCLSTLFRLCSGMLFCYAFIYVFQSITFFFIILQLPSTLLSYAAAATRTWTYHLIQCQIHNMINVVCNEGI